MTIWLGDELPFGLCRSAPGVAAHDAGAGRAAH